MLYRKRYKVTAAYFQYKARRLEVHHFRCVAHLRGPYRTVWRIRSLWAKRRQRWYSFRLDDLTVSHYELFEITPMTRKRQHIDFWTKLNLVWLDCVNFLENLVTNECRKMEWYFGQRFGTRLWSHNLRQKKKITKFFLEIYLFYLDNRRANHEKHVHFEGREVKIISVLNIQVWCWTQLLCLRKT